WWSSGRPTAGTDRPAVPLADPAGSLRGANVLGLALEITPQLSTSCLLRLVSIKWALVALRGRSSMVLSDATLCPPRIRASRISQNVRDLQGPSFVESAGRSLSGIRPARPRLPPSSGGSAQSAPGFQPEIPRAARRFLPG